MEKGLVDSGSRAIGHVSRVSRAVIPAGDVKEGVWRFDLSSIPQFKAGTFRVEAGQLLHVEAHTIVLRVTSGQRIRVSFELQP